MPTAEDLAMRQALPLSLKIKLTEQRIREWYQHFGGQVFVSYSGGKDSTVLLDIVRRLYPDVPAVFSDTGLEYPEIKAFVKEYDNVEIVRPKMNFRQVIETYGYPLVSKEVSEAIHYARRILPEQKGETYTRRRQLCGCGAMGIEIKRAEMLGIYQGNRSDTYDAIKKAKESTTTTQYFRIELKGVNMTGLRSNEIYERAERGEQIGTNSQFNKTKWLPLALKAPFKISNYCCAVMKKGPLKKYKSESKRYPIVGTLTEESRLRKAAWLKHGCNAFDTPNKQSQPMSFWTEQDVLQYIKDRGLKIASVYGEIVRVRDDDQILFPWASDGKLKTTGQERTGCVFCAYGMHLEKKETRFQRLKYTHPRLWEYAIGGGQWVDNPDYIEGLSDEPDAIGWVNWNPEKIWIPDKNGLGMGFIFDKVNEIYGKEIYRYE